MLLLWLQLGGGKEVLSSADVAAVASDSWLAVAFCCCDCRPAEEVPQPAAVSDVAAGGGEEVPQPAAVSAVPAGGW
jgi:hypothetical protein